MHVCHIIHSLGAGGAEQVLVDLATVADKGGFSMSVIGLMGQPTGVNARALLELGVPVRTLGLRTRWDPRGFTRAIREVAALQPDIVHTHLKHADLVGAVAALRLRVPQVSTLHIIEGASSGTAYAKRWVAGKVRTRAAMRTIAVSEAQRQWYLEHFPTDPSRVVTIHNGVLPGRPLDAATRAATRALLSRSDADVLAANVALMRPGKGHDDLLAAIGMLPDDSCLHVVLVGDGPELGRLKSVVGADRSLSARVTFTGYREDVPQLLLAMDLVVHPSHADALPTALIHALAAGVPVVATHVGGIPEIVGDDSGVLVPPATPAVLARTLQDLSVDPGRRELMGAAGTRRFEARFDARMWAQRLGELYREVFDLSRSASGDSGR
jgi:glycosyltransferase involved in cell wall biosynthesis